MTPQVGGPINETWFSMFYDPTVQAALASSPNTYVIVDLVCTDPLLQGLISTEDQFEA